MKRLCCVMLSALLLVLSLGRLTALRVDSARAQAAFDALMPLDTSAPEAAAHEILPTQSAPQDAGEPTPDDRLAPLIAANPDLAAWLTVEGTRINCPVMYTPCDPDHYLRRDFEGRDSRSGTPYFSALCDADSNSLLVYGHNMCDGTVFSDLLLYADEAFAREHPCIVLDTPGGVLTFEPVAAFRECVHDSSEPDAFRYYDYVGVLTPERFDEYVARIRACALYDTGVVPAYGDRLLTLSTCSGHAPRGRMVLVAAAAEQGGIRAV